MIIAISGTPATGKTSVAKALGRKLRWPVYSLNDIAKQKKLYLGTDEKRRSEIVSINKIRGEVHRLTKKHKNFIIESHYAHDMPNDLTIILRAKPDVLYKRMAKKGWWKEKIEENIESELMEICRLEAHELGDVVYQVETTRKSPAQSAAEIADFVRSYSLMNRDLKVHDDLKHFFRKPAGRLLPGLNKKTVSLAKSASSGSFTILVGDSASHLLLNNGMNPDVIITDGFVKRKKFIKKIKFSGLLIRAKNPRGWITKSLWQAVAKAIGSGEPVRIQVDGEEDLAVLPAIIMAPEGSSILYGQPTEGLVYIKVDGKRRANAVKILKAIQKANQT